jgi:hypothetical protein
MEQIILTSMTFNSFNESAKLVAEIKKDSLSYETTFFIPVTEINRLLSILQKNNPDKDINDYLESLDLEDYIEYKLYFSALNDSKIDREEILYFNTGKLSKQIRA